MLVMGPSLSKNQKATLNSRRLKGRLPLGKSKQNQCYPLTLKSSNAHFYPRLHIKCRRITQQTTTERKCQGHSCLTREAYHARLDMRVFAHLNMKKTDRWPLICGIQPVP